MTGIFIRRWAGVLTAFAAMLAGCGGGGTETVTTALTPPLVSKLDGRVQPADVDHGVVSIKKRAASAAPVPSKVRLGALVDAKKDWWREAAPQWDMADFLEWATVQKMTVAISAIRAATPTTEASHGNLQRRFGSRGVDALDPVG